MVDQTFTTYGFKAAIPPAYAGTDTRVERTLPTRLGDVVNVKDWGAVGNNSTDDTAAINAAIDYAYTLGGPFAKGAIVYFPAGTYRITGIYLDRFGVTGFITLQGAGRGVSILRGNYNSTAAQMEEYPNGFLVNCGIWGDHVCGIQDLTIHNESQVIESGAFIMHSCGNSRFIENCHFIGMTAFVCQEASFGQSVRDCLFTCSRPPTLASDSNRTPLFSMGKFVDGYTALGATSLSGGGVNAITTIATVDTGNNSISGSQGVGFTPNHTFPVRFSAGAAVATATANSSGVITTSDFTISNPGSGYGSPPTYTIKHSNIHGSVGAYISGGLFYNCRAVGFDIGYSIVGAGTSVKCCTATQCGIGFTMGLKNGSNLNAAQLDGQVSPGQWYFLFAGDLTSCVADRCTWGIHAYSPRCMYGANRITGTTGPYIPAAIVSSTGLSWNGTSHVVTVTTVDNHNITGTPTVQIAPVGWTLDPDGFVTATVTGAKTFTYPGPLTTPPTFTTGTWNYPLEYGVNCINPGDSLFVANTIDASVSIASFVAEGSASNGRNAVWCTKGPYGWTLPAPDSGLYAAGAWEFDQCGASSSALVRSGKVQFPAIPNIKYLPGMQSNIPGYAMTGAQINTTSSQASSFGDVISAFLYTTVSALSGTNVLTFASVPSFINNSSGFTVDPTWTGDNTRTIVSTTGTTVTLSSNLSTTVAAGSRVNFNRVGGSNKYKVRYDGEAWRRIA